MTAVDALDLVTGAAEVMLAWIIVRAFVRVGHSFAWMLVLSVFFVIRGGDRVYAGITSSAPSRAVELAADLVALVAIVMLIFGIARTVEMLRGAQIEANRREAAYRQALADYQRVARHRLANPLAAIKGGAATLRARPDLDARTRDDLLRAIEEQADELASVSLDPRHREPEEQGLSPFPGS